MATQLLPEQRVLAPLLSHQWHRLSLQTGGARRASLSITMFFSSTETQRLGCTPRTPEMLLLA